MDAEVKELTWDLADQGMDVLERAGLAALYISLKAAREAGQDLSPVSWQDQELTPTSVTVRWQQGKAKEAFTKLFEWCWQVKDGVLYCPAVHRTQLQAENLQYRLPLHAGVLGTFLQHRAQVQKAGKPVNKTLTLNEGEEIRVRYEPLQQVDLAPLKCLAQLMDATTDFQERVRLASWVKPGCTTRYPSERTADAQADWQSKPWQGSLKQALLLMLGPMVCWYMRLPSQQSKAKGKASGESGGAKQRVPKWLPNWAVLIPDIEDLAFFDEEIRASKLDLSFTNVASLGDAALRFVIEFASDPFRRKHSVGCRAVALGRVSYYPNQNVRKCIMDFSPVPGKRKRYQVLHQKMDNHWVPLSQATELAGDAANATDDDAVEGEARGQLGFIAVPSARGRIADNLVAGRAWYSDLAVPLDWQLDSLEWQRKKKRDAEEENGQTISVERLWFENLCLQSPKLRALASEEVMWDSEDDRIFLRVMHDMLSTLIWKENKAAQERGGTRTIGDRIEDLKEKIRRDLENAKTRALLRDTLSKWLVKGGTHDAVREHKDKVWGLLNDQYDWQKARDLARLALITYESKSVSISEEPDWSVLSEELQAKLDFDADRMRLRWIGAMSEEERDALKDLFTMPGDQAAIDELYRKSQEF
jgi:CRISPR-associated protein Cas8a1/Csx13